MTEEELAAAAASVIVNQSPLNIRQIKDRARWIYGRLVDDMLASQNRFATDLDELGNRVKAEGKISETSIASILAQIQREEFERGKKAGLKLK